MGEMGEARHETGTEWRIWDLHVHTPSSLVNHYGGDSDATWDRFIADLESLPTDIRVIGINDYWFLDGYKRVLDFRRAGRLQNLDAIFPVLELRLDQFGGTDGHLTRVNLHVVFDPELTPAVIEGQFINALSASFKLDAGVSSATWQGAINRDSLADLGREIKESVPESERSHFASDLMEGFNNLNVSFDQVKNILSGTYLSGRTLIGVGKAEWSSIKWNDKSIAAKKNTSHSADFVFSAFRDVSSWEGAVEKLRSANANHKILDCSDAHYFSNASQNERLGQCKSWLNTTPTFAGLVHALNEYDHRVYVGLEPPSRARIRMRPEQFISSVKISSNDPLVHTTFDYELHLNPGFVAVVGNKGQGKSALLDCIAVAGNSLRSNEFSFLTNQRFLSPGNRSSAEYFSRVTWASGVHRQELLTKQHDRSAPVSVEYLPQAFVERVCNISPSSGEVDAFDLELKNILFTHIREEDKAGATTFDELQQQKTRSVKDQLDRLRDDLRDLIANYIDSARFRAEVTEGDVQAKLVLKHAEIAAARSDHKAAQAELAALDSIDEADTERDLLRTASSTLEEKIDNLVQSLAENERANAQTQSNLLAMDSVMQRVNGLREDVSGLNAEVSAIVDGFDQTAPLFSIQVDDARYDAWRQQVSSEQEDRKSEHERLSSDLRELRVDKDVTDNKLAAVDGAHELARRKLAQADQRIRTLVGKETDVDSQAGLESLLARVRAAPDRLADARKSMLEQAGLIHAALRSQLDLVASLYEPASQFVDQSDVIKNAGLRFNVDLRILSAWDTIPKDLHLGRNLVLPEWLSELPGRVKDTEWPELESQIDEAIRRLECEKGELGGSYRDPARALKSSAPVDEFLKKILDLNWLEARIGLTGNGLPLAQLSPGQRGLVLALFYLVVDLRTTPLLLDQPEENLDNETIKSLLVPAIREASGRRQTIVVTHNANLAVVGDADQIVHCRLEDGSFKVSSGCISEIGVARFTVDVLEGTKEAFDNRRSKYEAFPALR